MFSFFGKDATIGSAIHSIFLKTYYVVPLSTMLRLRVRDSSETDSLIYFPRRPATRHAWKVTTSKPRGKREPPDVTSAP